MKGTVTIPKWIYAFLLAGAILNILNFVYKNANDEPKIQIHYHDERK